MRRSCLLGLTLFLLLGLLAACGEAQIGRAHV